MEADRSDTLKRESQRAARQESVLQGLIQEIEKQLAIVGPRLEEETKALEEMEK
jgi:hypothetical protein